MAEVKFIEHKGKKILLMDYSKSPYVEILKAVEETKKIVAQQPPHSILGIVDISDSGATTEISNALKDLAAHNKPYIIVSVVVGIVGLKRILFEAIVKFTGRKNLLASGSLEEAKEFLVNYKEQ